MAGNVKKLKEMPEHTRAGDNDNAFTGGYRLWTGEKEVQPDSHPTHNAQKMTSAPEVHLHADPEPDQDSATAQDEDDD